MSTVPEGGGPAAEFAEVWEMLDSLPRSAGGTKLTATTLDLVAAVVERDEPARAAAGPRAGWRHWLAPTALVAAALAAGFAAGRATAPDADEWVLQSLPLVRHLQLVREAGSAKFLEEVARRRYPLPVRPGPPSETRQEETREYQAGLERLREELSADGTREAVHAARRAAVEALPADEKVELERALSDFRRLSGAEQRLLAATAAALVDPTRPELREAALIWHRWLTVIRPEDRADIVVRGTEQRLAWLDWYASRAEGRAAPPPRPREWDRDRRGPPPEGGPPRGPDGRPRWPPPRGGPPGRGEGEAPAEGPRFRPPRPPLTTGPAGVAPSAPPAETPAAPR